MDAAAAMVAAAHRDHPDVPVVQADLAALPLAAAGFDGVWASKAHQHITAAELPLALAEVHRVLRIHGCLALTMFGAPPDQPTSEVVTDARSRDDLPGRLFTLWDPAHLGQVIAAAGFSIERTDVVAAEVADSAVRIEIEATAQRALPDFVAAGMNLLCCGLNPSLHAADAGVGYVTGSNRFWKALDLAGLSTVDRDPRQLLRQDRIGMTDLVKRPTARASELETAEYRDGVDRLERLCRWLRPRAVAVVGLSGWRAAVDRQAVTGWQPRGFGPTPVYVMPSTSGLNARVPLTELAGHLRAAANGPG